MTSAAAEMKMTFLKCVKCIQNSPSLPKELQLPKRLGITSCSLSGANNNFIYNIYHKITAACTGHCTQGVQSRSSHHAARLSLSTVYIIFICQITALHWSWPWQCLWMVSSINRSTLWAAETLNCWNGWRNYFHGSVKTAVIVIKLILVCAGVFQLLTVVCQMKGSMQMEWIIKIIIA